MPPFIHGQCHQLNNQMYPDGNVSNWIFTAALCCSIGGGIRLLCYRSLGDFFTWEVSLQKSQRLITTGPYSYIRHPSYLGSFFVYLGICLFVAFAPGTFFHECVAGRHPLGAFLFRLLYWTYSVFVVGFLFSRTVQEDRLLRERFGKEWEQWVKQTPYRIFPFVF